MIRAYRPGDTQRGYSEIELAIGLLDEACDCGQAVVLRDGLDIDYLKAQR